jgi:uncharacterized protein (TIGR00297 family)
MLMDLLIIFFIIIMAIVANKGQSLSKSGAIAAIVVGGLIYQGLYLQGLLILGTFFCTSSFWSFYKSKLKKDLEEKHEKGSKRDWIQVFANGGVAALSSFLYYFTNDVIWVIAFLTSLASATGDTWSSEIGPLSKRPPVSVKSFKVVEAGTSGAVSTLGTISAIVGVGVITIVGMYVLPITAKMAWIIFVFGILGNGIDTYLGAYFQRTYRCRVCSLDTEKPIHCNEKARKIGGSTLLNNDGVNFLAGLFAPIFAILTYQILL